ncbi:MAG TPA: TolC family protein [Fibrobacteraceae bacterium]|nr:TolC family protein [Fibrobacteraceae bacterium]
MNKVFLFCALSLVPISAQTPLSLEQCVNVAKEKSASVKEANQDLEAAKEIKDQAYTHWFPTVSAQATALKAHEGLVQYSSDGGNLPVYNGDPSTLSSATQFAYMPTSTMSMLEQMGVAMISVVQPIYMGGRISNGNKLAGLGVDVARIQRIRAEKEAVLATMDRYYNLAALHATQATLLAQLQLMDSLNHDVQLAFRNGLATSRDTLDLSQRQLTARKQLLDVQDGIQLAEKDLCRSLDGFCSGQLALTDTLGPLNSPDEIRVDHEQALPKREESQLLDKAVAAEKMQRAQKRGEFLPQALVGAAVMEMGDFNDSPTSNALVFANISVPISGLWEMSHKDKESRSRVVKADLSAQDGKGLIRLEMDKAWNDLLSSWRQLDLVRVRMEKEATAMKDARQNLAQGLGKPSDLIATQLGLQAAAEAEIAARRAYLHSRAVYLKATGREPCSQ